MEQIVVLKLNDKREKYDKNIDPKINGQEVAKRIGSQFKPGTRDTIRGLSSVQERIYLPNVLGLQPNDADFPLKAKDFWSDYTLTPTVEGLKLNIGTVISQVAVKVRNDKGQEVEEMQDVETPVNWDDYIAYKFAMSSSQVAKGTDLDNLAFFDFYLIDLAQENKKKVSEFEVQDKADNYYARLALEDKWAQNEQKVDWIIELMRDKKLPFSLGSMSITEKKMMLHKFKTDSPSLFVSIYDKPNLETTALISKCVSNRVLIKEGDNHFFNEENIGSSDTVVAWFNNPVNSGKVQIMKSRLEDTILNKRQ